MQSRNSIFQQYLLNGVDAERGGGCSSKTRHPCPHLDAQVCPGARYVLREFCKKMHGCFRQVYSRAGLFTGTFEVVKGCFKHILSAC